MSGAGSDIAIVGGGLVGAVAALALAERGRSVTLIERDAPRSTLSRFGMDVRNVAVSPGSASLFDAIGVWRRLAPARYRRMEVWEERGTESMTFDAQELGRRELGWILENGPTLEALWSALREAPNVEILLGCPLEAVEASQEGVRLLVGERHCEARLLIGADGAASAVRQHCGVSVERQPTGHEALATLVRTQEPHDGVALQRFLLEGPLALLPSREASVSSVVWSQPPEQASRRVGLPEQAFCEEIAQAIEHRLGAVTAVAERYRFPLVQQLVDDFNPKPRVLLVGDAARILHPLAGLGANVGFEDVAMLLAVVDSLPAAADPGAEGIWRRYARERRARAQLMLRLMAGFREIYAAGAPLAQWLRNAGVGWLDRTLPLKRQLMREALGVGSATDVARADPAHAGRP